MDRWPFLLVGCLISLGWLALIRPEAVTMQAVASTTVHQRMINHPLPHGKAMKPRVLDASQAKQWSLLTKQAHLLSATAPSSPVLQVDKLTARPSSRPFVMPALGHPIIESFWGKLIFRLLLTASLPIILLTQRMAAVHKAYRQVHRFALVATSGEATPSGDTPPKEASSAEGKDNAEIVVEPKSPPGDAADTEIVAESIPLLQIAGAEKYVDPVDPYKPVFWAPPPPSAAETSASELQSSSSSNVSPILEAPEQATAPASAQAIPEAVAVEPVTEVAVETVPDIPKAAAAAVEGAVVSQVTRPTEETPAKSEVDEPATLATTFSAEDLMSMDTSSPRAVPEVKPFMTVPDKEEMQSFLFPPKEQMPEEVYMSIWDHVEELRERVAIAAIGCIFLVMLCFIFSKDLVLLLQDPVAEKGVRFLQLTPGEYFFTTVKVAGYSGLLLGAPLVLYQVMAYITPGLTQSERKFIGPIVLGSSILFYVGLLFSYVILTPAALNFFVSYGEDAVESLWSIDQYFEFVLVLMLSTGLSFQVPIIQVLLGTLRIVSSEQMLSGWRYVVVGATIVAAVLTPSTDPFTQLLLALPLIGLYLGGAFAVKAVEASRQTDTEAMEY